MTFTRNSACFSMIELLEGCLGAVENKGLIPDLAIRSFNSIHHSLLAVVILYGGRSFAVPLL
jgi:hypothetical protein